MSLLTLVRHGQTESNLHGRLDTRQPGAPLTHDGHEQAQRRAVQLQGAGIDRIVTSPWSRTRQTAAIIGATLHIPVSEDIRLREIPAGTLELRNDQHAKTQYQKLVEHWARGGLEHTISGSESALEFFTRLDTAVEEATAGAAHALIVGHGAAVRVWAASRTNCLTPEQPTPPGLANAGAIELERADERWNLLQWQSDPDADAGHDPTGSAR